MKSMKFLLLASFVLLVSLPGQAQKFGYLNSQVLLAELPEVAIVQTRSAKSRSATG